MREIVFDTETTGLSFNSGDRLVEIGCIEMVNRVETGRTFHCYLNPDRPMPVEAFRIHGLSDAFLSDKPRFHEKVEDLLEFIGESKLIAHNATFDFGFLNGELGKMGRAIISLERMVDTVAMARQRHPGAKHSLDALCTRYGIDRSHRVLHGALLDAQLLAQVYIELTGGRQIGLTLVSEESETIEIAVVEADPRAAQPRPMRMFEPSAAEIERHAAFVAKLKNPLWGADASG